MKTVLVTGAGRGLGLATTRRLKADGYRVVALSRTITAELEEVAAGPQKIDDAADGSVHPLPYDLDQVDGIHELVKTIGREYGPIFGLVNNAAVGIEGVLATQHVADVEKMVRVNLLSAIVLTKSVSRSMMSRRTGRIVSISSIIANTGFSGLSVYAATKAGLEGFSRSLARELGKVGITVNCVAPGYMETAMTSGLSDDKLDAIKRRSPLGALARPRDVAGAVAYLMGPDGDMVTGTVLTVDGGSTA